LNRALLILPLLFAIVTAHGQLYLRGEVKDENDNPLSNAKIVLHSTGFLYYSGTSGTFGIITENRFDSITVALTGYQSVVLRVDASKYLNVRLHPLADKLNISKNRLLSFTKDLQLTDRRNVHQPGESYTALVENEFVETKKFPETGFAIRIDKASYSNVRRFINMDTKVPPDAVRIEELLNYFNFGYKEPPPDSVFAVSSRISDCPWNPSNHLLFVQVCARKIEPEKIPPSNLVFLIDISGSMDMPNRLPLLKSAFKLLVDNLRESDTISIVVYGSAVGVWLTPTSGKEKLKIRKAIEDLSPAGATPGQSGILSAYRLAKSQYIEGGNNRVILATDGDFNIGVSSEEQLEKLITDHKESGIYLTCLGVGMGNYKDSKLEVLAKKGNGNFSYLDNEAEAEKVLVKELTSTLYSVADDASLSMTFNDRLVKEYRLIGYDNKMKALSDSLVNVEGGEVGSGHSLMVLIELKPTLELSSALQYSGGEPNVRSAIATLAINYRLPLDTIKRLMGHKISYNYTPYQQLETVYQFASAVAMFGTLLKESPYSRQMTWNEALIAADRSFDSEDAVQKEFIAIMSRAKKIYSKTKRKKAAN
jgi:Ca-activated chloride channel homolog